MIWKLLRQHISLPQLLGFAVANFAGMLIVLMAYQFYRDVIPVFNQPDNFMRGNYLILAKKTAASFADEEIDQLAQQPFVTRVAPFESANYRADVRMGVNGQQLVNSELFFESVPDSFVDLPLSNWDYTAEARQVPVILPRSYLSMYNFGIAQSRKLPKINEGLVGMIDFRINIKGDEYKGKVVGFTNRLNTILVPQKFMTWSNSRYGDGDDLPTRLIFEVSNPADDRIATWIDGQGYELETGDLNAEKTTYFLRLVAVLVMGVGLVISILSFYILMLSIFLLVQKNADKLQNLLLIGYSPARVARPYQWLTIGLNAVVLALALALLWLLRGYWLDVLYTLFPDMRTPTMMPAVLLGLGLFLLVSLLNVVAIRRKIVAIWKNKE